MDGGPCGHDDGGDAFATGTKRDHQHLSLGGHDDPEAGPAETKRPRLEEDDDADATRGQRAGRGAFAAHDDDHDDERDEEEDTQDYDEDDRDEDEDWEEGSRGSDEDNSFETDPNASFDVYDDEDDDDDDDEINGDDSLDAIEGYEDEDDETAAERKRAAEGLRSSARIKAIKESGPRTAEREGEASSSGLRQRSKSGKRKSKSKKTEGEESKGNGRERNRDRERERRRRRKRESARRFNANLESTSAAMAARRKELEEAEAKRAAQRNEQNFSWIFEDMSIEAVDQRRKEILEDWRFFSALHFLEKFGLVLDIPKTITLGNDFLEAFIGSFGIDGFQHVHSLHIHLLKHLKFRPIDLSSSTSTRQTLDPDTNETKTFTEAGWHRSMRIMVKRHYLDFPEGNPLESCPYNQLKLSDRVSLLHMLCEWITYDSSLIRDCLERTKIDDQFHRPLPVGYDETGAAYWRFGSEPSLFLYKETEVKTSRSSRPTNSNWELVCSHIDHWNALASRFENSQHPDEIEFRSFLLEELIPPLAQLQRARTSAERRMKREAIETTNILGTRRSARSRKNINYAEVFQGL